MKKGSYNPKPGFTGDTIDSDAGGKPGKMRGSQVDHGLVEDPAMGKIREAICGM